MKSFFRKSETAYAPFFRVCFYLSLGLMVVGLLLGLYTSLVYKVPFWNKTSWGLIGQFLVVLFFVSVDQLEDRYRKGKNDK